MTMPKNLKEKIEAIANDKEKTDFPAEFRHGAEALYAILMESAEEFDEDICDQEWDRNQNAYNTQPKSFLFKWGCRFQRSQLSAKLSARDARIKELEKYEEIYLEMQHVRLI